MDFRTNEGNCLFHGRVRGPLSMVCRAGVSEELAEQPSVSTVRRCLELDLRCLERFLDKSNKDTAKLQHDEPV